MSFLCKYLSLHLLHQTNNLQFSRLQHIDLFLFQPFFHFLSFSCALVLPPTTLSFLSLHPTHLFFLLPFTLPSSLGTSPPLPSINHLFRKYLHCYRRNQFLYLKKTHQQCPENITYILPLPIKTSETRT